MQVRKGIDQRSSRLGLLTALAVICLVSNLRAESRTEFAVVEMAPSSDSVSVVTQDAQWKTVHVSDQPRIEVATGHSADWPGITFEAQGPPWDLSDYQEIALLVTNVGGRAITVHCRVDCPGGDGQKNSITEKVRVEPNATRELKVPLRRKLPPSLQDKLFGMRGYPGGSVKEGGLDTTKITQFIVFLHKPQQDQTFRLGNIRARGHQSPEPWRSLDPDKFFPMIDRFGQFIHGNWPGKTVSLAALRTAGEQEQAELAAHPGPTAWNQYGGWAEGPQLKATGFFYPTKLDGKWWLVDPEGRLFWSHGVDCVGYSQGTTPISDREFYFAELPEEDSPLAVFYGHASWAPHGYYQGKGRYRTFCFSGANLHRKYGEAWRSKTAEMIHRRLRSWSMNTIANWSDATVYSMRKTPYVVSAGSHGAKSIEGSSGYWGKFPDPFDASFEASVNRRLQGEADRSANDPWCIGYFVDNELGWGDELSLAKAALQSPPEQAAKQAFLADLKQKYHTIDALNKAWEVDHDSWQALAECRDAPDEDKAKEDLAQFYSKIAEKYFQQCRQAVKRVAPHNLYLGCRFAWVNDRGARAAAKYCDVIGYNLYRDSVTDFQLPTGVDMPVVVGEFHFGALDRGMFHTGLRPTNSQQDRAQAYRDYVTGALRHPSMVGTHWFQYGDQATTGRGDGENYQIGLVDICDRPYPETIQAVREIGNAMYELRRAAN